MADSSLQRLAESLADLHPDDTARVPESLEHDATVGDAIPLAPRTPGFHAAPSSSIYPASSIYLTTGTDVVGFASLLGFAVAFMPLLLG